MIGIDIDLNDRYMITLASEDGLLSTTDALLGECKRIHRIHVD